MNHRIRKNRYKNPFDQPPKTVFMRIADIIFKSLCSVAFIGGMSLMFIFGHDVLTQCEYFKAQHVIIRGDCRLTPEEIMDVAKIEKGTNILSVNLPAVKKRLSAIPWIAEAEVYREFPGSIIILIKEHKPLAVIDLGRAFLFNERGDIFKEASDEEMKAFPVITGVDSADWKTSKSQGAQVFTAIMEILKMGKVESEVITNKTLKTIQVDREIGLTLQADCPIENIKLGYGNFRAKYDRLAKIFSYIKQNEKVPAIREIDLRVPDHVAACLSEDQSPEEGKKEVNGGKA